MISMTAYWQQFKECIDSLPLSTQDKEYSRQIEVANNLLKIGLAIEKLGITEIQQVVNQLGEKAKLFKHEVSYKEDRDYTFYLPKINTTESLIFAIIYYQHLIHYQDVSYQGSINWFRQKVIDGVNEQKIKTAIQAKALLQEIHHYCESQNITVNESLFLKAEDESNKDYSARILNIFSKPDEQPKTATLAILQSDPIATLEKTLEKLKHRSTKLKEKTDSVHQKLSALNKAKQEHLKLTEEWQSKWFITRSFYRFLALFCEVPLIKNLKIAQEQLIKADNELKQELLPYSPELYTEKLHAYQQKLICNQLKIECEITQKKETQHPSSEENIKNTPESHIVCIPHTTAPKCKVPEERLETSSNNDYYGFFKRHTLSGYPFEAIVVGIAAVAIQNLL